MTKYLSYNITRRTKIIVSLEFFFKISDNFYGDKMKTIGIIVEYNPFHNGHKYQIEKAKEITGADTVVVVMSPNFVMRGEPAITDKFTRTKLALENGVDLVLELPTIYAVQSADVFAYKSIEILKEFNIDYLVFGAETDNINILKTISDAYEKEEYNKLIKKYLDEGKSFQSASKKAISDLIQDADEILSKPNNILAVQYLRGLKKLNCNIEPVLIKRIEAEYHDDKFNNTSIQSASAIRKGLLNGEDITNYTNLPQNGDFVTLESFFKLISYSIYSKSLSELREIFGISEGLENLLKTPKVFENIDDFITSLKSKRYTETRIKRILIYILLNIRKKDVDNNKFEYIKVLGFNKNGQIYLNKMKKLISVPLITNLKKSDPKSHLLELKISKIYSLVSNSSTYFKEYYQPIVILDE